MKKNKQIIQSIDRTRIDYFVVFIAGENFRCYIVWCITEKQRVEIDGYSTRSRSYQGVFNGCCSLFPGGRKIKNVIQGDLIVPSLANPKSVSFNIAESDVFV